LTTLRLHPPAYGNQNYLLEKLHHEAIQIHSIDANYIPRTLIAEDKIFGEDQLSEFRDAFPIQIYLETVDAFEGQNSFASKFGLQIDSNATIVISKLGWEQAVGRYGKSILPNRPAESDLIYIPMAKAMFEINYVDNKKPFYQLGQYYSYRCTIDMFRYSSERITTGDDAIDTFQVEHSTDVTVNPSMDELVRAADNKKFIDRANDLVLDQNNPFGDL